MTSAVADLGNGHDSQRPASASDEPVPQAVLLRERPAPVTDEPASQTLLLRERVLKEIDPSLAVELTANALQRQLERIINEIADEQRIELSAREQTRLAEELVNDMTGLGPLEPLLRDETITDIMVNGPSNVYIEQSGRLEK